ncbi:ABC transporter permease [Guggenheimella bovis]
MKILRASFMSTMKQLIDAPMGVLIIVALPLLLSLLMGGIEGVEPEKFEPMEIAIVDQDETEQSKLFTSILSSEGMKSIFSFDDDAKVRVILQKGFGEALGGEGNTKIIIKTTEETADFKFMVVENVVQSIAKGFRENTFLSKLEDQELAAKVRSLDLYMPFKDVEVSFAKKLSKKEQVAGTYFPLSILMLTSMYYLGHQKLKETNVLHRILSSPLTPSEFLTDNVFSLFLQGIIYTLFYFLFFKLTGMAFKEVSLLEILPMILVSCLYVAGLSMLETRFFLNKEVGQVLSIIVLYVQMILAGIMFPIETQNPILLTIMKYSPTRSMINGMNLLQGGGTFVTSAPNMIPVACGALVTLAIGYALCHVKYWEV